MRAGLHIARLGLLVLAFLAPATLAAQARPAPADPVLERIEREAAQRSELRSLAGALLDSIGHRLTGSPAQLAAHEWALSRYEAWGIEARNEPYGTWRGWRRGATHVDLVAPRAHTLRATMLPWSPASNGPVTAGVVLLPEASTPAGFAEWLPRAAGRFVLISPPPPTCRPESSVERFGLPGALERIRAERQAVIDAWGRRLRAAGPPHELPRRLEQAGAAGVLVTTWTGAWGADHFHQPALTQRVPALTLGCEDYTLVARLAAAGRGPVLRVEADSESLGEMPALNTVAEIRGRERPDEFVVLSAHFDSWDGHSGATDNGAGTIAVMEAMRVLRGVYPAPRRTILAGHWGGEEQGLNGSRAFVADHPHVVDGLHVLLNLDTGTGRVREIRMEGLSRAAERFRAWFARMPPGLVGEIALVSPDIPSAGSSDHSSFVCAGAPAFFLRSVDWDYGAYTWHTDLDSPDKLVWEDVQRNAVILAMLAYLAAEDEAPFPRDRAEPLPVDPRTGEPTRWPVCQPPLRSTPDVLR